MTPALGLYPKTLAARRHWIEERRGPKNVLDPAHPYAALWEEEAGPGGDQISTATIFLTNRECPYRCLMCDLWQNTPKRACRHQCMRASRWALFASTYGEACQA